MSVETENEVIERLAGALRWYGCGPVDVTADGELVSGGCSAETEEYDERIEYAHGHAGEGWYLGCGNYPDDGAEFIAPGEYGALLVAQAIVAEERAAIAESAARQAPQPATEPTPPVSFNVTLMAVGSADVLAEDLYAHGSTSVLIFAAGVEEVRKAAPIFRQPVTLTTAPSLLQEAMELRAGIAWYRDEFPEADGRGDDEVLARIDAAIARAGG